MNQDTILLAFLEDATDDDMVKDHSGAASDYIYENTSDVPIFVRQLNFHTAVNYNTGARNSYNWGANFTALTNGIAIGYKRNGQDVIIIDGLLTNAQFANLDSGPANNPLYDNTVTNFGSNTKMDLGGLILYPGDQLFVRIHDDLTRMIYMRALFVGFYGKTTLSNIDNIDDNPKSLQESLVLTFLEDATDADMNKNHAGAASDYYYENTKDIPLSALILSIHMSMDYAVGVRTANTWATTGAALTNGISIGIVRNGQEYLLLTGLTRNGQMENLDCGESDHYVYDDATTYGVNIKLHVKGLILFPGDRIFIRIHDDLSSMLYMRAAFYGLYGKA